jgi:hypothetical protein
MVWYLFTAIDSPPGGSGTVNLCKNRKQSAIYKRRKNTQSNTKTQNTQDRKQT